VRLVVTPLEASATALPENRALIELLAQGHRWLECLVCPNVSPDDAILRPSGRWPRPVRTGFGESSCGYWMLPAISGTRGAMRLTVSSESQCRM
jgi:hypothetical protein